MIKIVKVLLIAILLGIVGLVFIFFTNPMNLRNRIIGSVINSYLSNTIEGYSGVKPSDSNLDTDKNPLLNAGQEQALENIGVNVEALPQELTPAMQACLLEKLGEARAKEIVAGATPSPTDFFKAKDCLGQ